MGPLTEVKARHVTRSLVLSPPQTGIAPITVDGAVFEMWDYSGHVFINVYSLRDALFGSKSEHMGWKFWQKKVSSLEAICAKYHLGHNAWRPGMPFGEKGNVSEPERCLTFPSISVALLLTMSLRAAFTTAQSKGRVRETEVREGLGRVFEGMMKHLPLDHRWGKLVLQSVQHSSSKSRVVAHLLFGAWPC